MAQARMRPQGSTSVGTPRAAWVRFICGHALLLGLAGCGSGGEHTDAGTPNPRPGDAGAPTTPPWFDELPAIEDRDALQSPAYFTPNPEEPELRLSGRLLSVRLAPEGSLSGWQGLLAAEGARMVAAEPGSFKVWIAFATPATTRAELDERVEALEADPSVVHVIIQRGGVEASLPPGVDVSQRDVVEAHLVVGAHRLWDLRDFTGLLLQGGVMADGPALHVIDHFANGLPALDLYEGDWGSSFLPVDGPGVRAHGYEVLSVLQPRWDFMASGAYTFETAALAGPLAHPYPMTLLDVETEGTLEWLLWKTAELPDELDTRVVVHQAVHPVCDTADLGCFRDLERQAGDLRDRIVAVGTGDRLLYVAAAGNVQTAPSRFVRPAGFDDARYTTPLGLLELPIVLLVENALHAEYTPPPDTESPYDPEFELCLASSSHSGGHVSAPGTDIGVYDSVGNYRLQEGTSFAAPQVAGAATLLWQHAPSESSSEIVSRILATARPFDELQPSTSSRCAATSPAPLLDSHQAVLAADLAQPSALVRRALLDVNQDGVFDAADVREFLDHFADPANEGQVTYDRFDLNGDGRIGFPTARYDLDGPFAAPGTPLAYDFVRAEHTDADGVTLQVTFDERAVTDLDVLCYYAYSPLFPAAEAAERNRLLYETYRDRRQTCRGLDVTISAPEAVCPQSTANGEWFAIGLRTGFRSAYPLEVTMTASGDGAIQAAVPAVPPPASARPGSRSNPKTLTRQDPDMVMYGTVTAPGPGVTIDIEIAQTNASGVRQVLKIDSVTVAARPTGDCEIPGAPAPLGPKGSGGWRSYRNQTTTFSDASGQETFTVTGESWVTRSEAVWHYGARTSSVSSVTTIDSDGNATTATVRSTFFDRTIFDGRRRTRYAYSTSTDGNGVTTTDDPTVQSQECESSSCSRAPSAPELAPQCTSDGSVIGYDGGSYAWGSTTYGPGFSSVTTTSGSLTCVNCNGASTAGCSCTGPVRATCP